MGHRPTVLIAGASIAGPALAYWLDRYGWATTVVERAPEFRTGGQNIDVRGAAREVLRRAGLEDAVRDATTGERGTRFFSEHGKLIAEFPVQRSATAGATAEVEVLRGDLARILVDKTAGRTGYRYGDEITALTDTGSAVEVTFAGGRQEGFDLVVAADGLRSSTRRLLLDPADVAVRPLGMEMTYLTIARQDDDTDWWNWYNAPGGLGVTLRPDRHGTTRAVLSAILYDRAGAADWGRRRTASEQKDRLRRQFHGVAGPARRILDALDDAGDMYFESLAQIRATRWSRGRVALLGDAAWCAAPVSGMGTTLSIVGAYVLAGEIARHADHRQAFAGYERIMRPFVDRAQQLPPGVPRIANPRTPAGLAVFHAGLRLAATPLASRIGARLVDPPADRIDLPDYADLDQRQDGLDRI
ncbi:FAD-dependent monooxygenase [Actinoplanes sp. NBRC 101535]|uniref:FAD-dependent monooxygenase n=1 Tax=Actinoplanes sp. NBRC 101535 TaxID=3032196 RepID=UPI0024A4DFBD|nr:FAD-dependent monooxygenase [Actinoplanes sp. NBRC 101535]GLY02316.1 FAD-binding monooxygenase [Actinoplanes sp. NBRC 101535]